MTWKTHIDLLIDNRPIRNIDNCDPASELRINILVTCNCIKDTIIVGISKHDQMATTTYI